MVKRSLYSDLAASGGFGFNVFTDDEIDKIHLATLEVLEKTGLYVGTQEAMDVLEGGGARVDRQKKVAKFPIIHSFLLVFITSPIFVSESI